jgi:lipopolysaccharide/colanic/teichoic acid biosynthesis glycosyltransferase
VGAVASRWISSPWKRVFDLALAAPAMIVLSPLTALVALLVRVRHGSPVVFRQARAGLDGATIMVPKFRSMTDERGPDGELLPDAARLTAFGRKLRATSLDELPQLWTVIKGDMSLVGPRPLPTIYVDRYSPEQRRRLEARSGITGWAQVNGRNATTWPERLRNDVWYVDHASFRVDLRILWLTVKTAVSREGVSADDHATMHEFMGEV